MKKILIAILSLFITGVSFSQDVSIIESSENGLVLRFVLDDYSFEEVTTPRGNAFVPVISGSGNNYEKGAPALPSVIQAIAIPGQGGFTVELKSFDYETIQDIDIAPSKGTIYRNENPADIPYIYGEVYRQDRFLPEELCAASEPYILRDVRGSNIEFRPFVYNAVSKELRVYKEIVMEVKFNNTKSVNEISTVKKAKKHNKEFEQIYDRLFLNAQNASKYTQLEEPSPGKILVIAHDKYVDAVAPYMQWKRQKGMDAELVASSAIAETLTSNLLKTYIAERYSEDEDICYFLLVGDAADIPTSTNSFGDSDYIYVCLAGNDGYADAFIGRFSGNSVEHIQTQVERTIHYEKNLNETDTWLSHAFGSASREGAGQGHNNESDVQHINNIRTDLEAFGYTVTHVNESGGSNSAVSAAFNEGVGIANYIGHGDVQVWVNTYFNNSYVNSLTNDYKLPFIWSVACQNGNFRSTTCFAEAWLRATNDGNPTGAIAFLGSTIDQSWREPMDAQDEMVDILVGSYPDNIKRTIGGLSYNGIFKMIENGGKGQTMAYTWVLFGDPSLAVRTTVPTTMEIDHAEAIVIGTNTFDVVCDTEGALACISIEDEEGNVQIMGRAYVENGIAQLPLFIEDAREFTLTVTAYNKETIQKTIPTEFADGAYVVRGSFEILDTEGNNNGKADYGERIIIRQELKNVGKVASENLTIKATIDNSDVVMVKEQATLNRIEALSEAIIEEAFIFDIPKNIADQTYFTVTLTVSDTDGNTWNSNYSITVNAPVVTFLAKRVDDRTGGNSNWVANSGETIQLFYEISNSGSIDLAGPAVLSSEDEYVTMLQDVCDINIPVGETKEVVFEIAVTDVPDGVSELDFTLYMRSTTDWCSFSLPVNVFLEGWESNDFSLYEWDNTSEVPWTITGDDKFEGFYSLLSGPIGNKGTTTLTLSLNVKEDDTIEFYKKVSCEKPSVSGSGIRYYDNLAFYIDDEIVGQWGGEIDWSLESYEVKAGEREFKWEYSKDTSLSENRDCAWIDNIKLPAFDGSVNITSPETADNLLKVYPNPASNYLNILLPEASKGGKSIIKIRDINGRIVLEYHVILSPSSPLRIDTGSIAGGYYLVEVATGEEIYIQQLIIN